MLSTRSTLSLSHFLQIGSDLRMFVMRTPKFLATHPVFSEPVRGAVLAPRHAAQAVTHNKLSWLVVAG